MHFGINTSERVASDYSTHWAFVAVKMDKLLICIHFLYLLLLSVHFALNKQFETPNVVRTEYRDLRARAEF